MVEGVCEEVPEDTVLEALLFAMDAVQPLLAGMNELREKHGRPKRVVEEAPPVDQQWVDKICEAARPGMMEIFQGGMAKQAQHEAMRALRERIVVEFAGEDEEREGNAKKIVAVLEDLESRELRSLLVGQGLRIDGRDPKAIRPISGDVGWLPRTHGSALFTRGETQAMVSCTLGTGGDEQIVEALEGEARERFLLHYNFPPYSVGEVRRIMGPGRREIGHGILARRALESVIPDHEHFPYTIRIVSDISESNGSSSMAPVCGGTLAMMDAGVPIRAPVAGIAMGLVHEGWRAPERGSPPFSWTTSWGSCDRRGWSRPCSRRGREGTTSSGRWKGSWGHRGRPSPPMPLRSTQYPYAESGSAISSGPRAGSFSRSSRAPAPILR
jgi:polyribonucleotide nucleotidyltransferase